MEINRIPDAINCAAKDNYTRVPNELLRNPEISAKAKTVLCILLSNSNGWTSYLQTLEKMMKESRHTIQYALKELQVFKYLKIIRYRDAQTKRVRGYFWSYTSTPGIFDLERQFKLFQENGIIVDTPTKKDESEADFTLYDNGKKPESTFSTSGKLPPKKNKEEKRLIERMAEKSVKPQFVLWNELPSDWKTDVSFQQAIQTFGEYRIEIKKPLTQQAVKLFTNKIKTFPKEIVINSIHKAIENSWTTVYPESEKNVNKHEQQNNIKSPVYTRSSIHV